MVLSLVVCPLIAAILMLLARNHKAVSFIAIAASIVTMILSAVVSVSYFASGWTFNLDSYRWLPSAMMLVEAAIALYITIAGIKAKNLIAPILAIGGTGLMLWHELTAEHTATASNTMMMDKLSIIMILIIGIIGSLICIYTVTYMKDFAHHHHDIKDRRVLFISVLFIFLSAMFGLVISNSLGYLFFFWEITTFCSFILIGYTKTPEAIKNSFKALCMNMFGGFAFALGIVLLARLYNVHTFNELYTLDSSGGAVAIIVFLIAFAGLTKSAQMPFSTWLLGAMVAPTPSSALLHSSTMVKAGVYLLIRISPLLGDTVVGRVVTLVGAFTFLVTALLAVSQRDAKKILAYSTISNLGLIVMCASIGTSDSIWTAIMMIIFHAVAKSLLFLAVGSVDHQIGSRDTEDMDGLLRVSPFLSFIFIVGIIGMFLAPFGMVVAKWAAMKALVDTNNVVLLMTLAFGSSVTLFYWTKWLGKIISNRRDNAVTLPSISQLERIPLLVLSALTLLSCFLFSVISHSTIEPFLAEMFHVEVRSPIPDQDSNVLLLLLLLLFILPVIVVLTRKNHPRKTLVYMAGENTGDNKSFHGSMNQVQQIEMRNWYLEELFGEKVLLNKCLWISGIGLLLALFIVSGGVLI